MAGAAAPPSPPPPPPYELVLTWLDEVCGGRAAVAGLGTEPIVEDGLDLPDVEHPAHRERLEVTAERLESVAHRLFDTETSFAFRRALLTVWADEPELVTSATSAAMVAGGICWAVGKANGRFAPAGTLTQTEVRTALALSGSLAPMGRRVEQALRGFRPVTPSGAAWHARPVGLPDLLQLGRTDVLVASTRHLLVRLRDRAEEARAASAA